MKNSKCCDGGLSLALLAARLPLAATLIFAGINKLRADGGASRFAQDHLSQVPSYMPDQFGHYYLTAVPYAEVVLGGLLLVGLLTRFSGLLTALMLASFAIATKNYFSTSGGPLISNPVLYGSMSLVVLLAGPGKISVDALLFGRRKTTACSTD